MTLGAYEWIGPLTDAAGKAIKGIADLNTPPPPPPPKPQIPWVPIIAGTAGLFVVGAVLMTKKKRRR